MLYDRDYKILTDAEKQLYSKAELIFTRAKERKKGVSVKELFRYYKILPKAALHYKQLFPNNYFDNDDYKDLPSCIGILKEFEGLIDNKANERAILNFIKEKKAWFLITSLLNGLAYNFGNHGIFLFREFELPPNHVADFLIIGKNSGGFEFVFVELESPFGQITTLEGEFGTIIRKGLKQVNDWESWLEANYSHLRLIYNRHLGELELLPEEFYQLDKSRLHYAIVAGRRTDFSKKTYQLKRKLKRSSHILVLHYDNIIDSATSFIRVNNS